jgi:ribonucleoside-triphosphate reductase (formate)
VPKHFETVPAIGPGGEFTGRPYGDYAKTAQRFVWAIFDVYLEGDASGRPFFFPKPLVHITEKFFKTDGHAAFLEHICRVAAEKGNTYFVFDRGDTAKISECCRLSFKLDASDLNDANEPWKMRYSALQNVTINLPRVAYRAEGNDTELFKMLAEQIELAVKAHIEKRNFIQQLLDQGETGPLAMLAMKADGQPYLRMHRVSYLIGMVGLNELVQYHRGSEMHESVDALRFGLKVIAHMKLLADRLGKRHDMKCVLEQTPAESTAYRFAKLDSEDFPVQARKTVKGNYATGEIYYSNSSYFNVSHDFNPIERVKKEGLFHPIIEAGALTHIWLGESRPSPASLANLIVKIFKQTQNDQVAFSPEFTTCLECGQTSRGLNQACTFCQSTKVEGITRITGYFTKIASWNKGKLGELRDRFRSQQYFQPVQ